MRRCKPQETLLLPTKMSKSIFPYVLVLPFLLLFIGFRLLPMIFTLTNALFDMSSSPHVFVGLTNIRSVLLDSQFWMSAYNTLIMFVVYLAIKLPLVIVLAYSFYYMKHKRFLMLVFYLPTLIGMFAYAIIFRYLFSYHGIINALLDNVFSQRVDWFGSAMAARLVIALAVVWGSLGFHILLFLNSLKNIPRSYFEVIDIHGGSSYDKILSVVLPLSRPVLKTIFFMSLLEFITLIDIPLNLTRGAPTGKTMTLSYYLYKQAIDYHNFSFASAAGVLIILLALIIVLTSRVKTEFDYEMD